MSLDPREEPKNLCLLTLLYNFDSIGHFLNHVLIFQETNKKQQNIY